MCIFTIKHQDYMHYYIKINSTMILKQNYKKSKKILTYKKNNPIVMNANNNLFNELI